MDIYKTLEDLKEKQEKIVELLNNLAEGKTQEKIYDLVDLQNLLHVSRRTIATWTKEGLLPHTKVGNKLWVTEEQLKAFLEKHSSKGELLGKLSN